MPPGTSGPHDAIIAPFRAAPHASSIPLELRFLDWPFFGRVPQRTQYLPTDQRSIDRPLDPPLKQAWSINTHGLIEFPPAIGGGVAYAINKWRPGDPTTSPPAD
jgi:hypothetical protein